jgi:DNA polymerase-3 subunit delta
MKFYSNQLSQLIEKIAGGTIKSLLLYGHNRGFISAIIEQLVKKFDFFSVNLNGKEATEANLNLLANTSNFFKQKELIKIDYNGSAVNKELMRFLTTGNFTNFICFIGDESLPSSGIRKLFEDSAHMAAIGCYYDDENMVVKLANSIALKHQKTISEEALFYIKVSLKGDYQIIKNELEKLINYTHNKGKITYEDAQAAISPDLSANGDEMCIFFSKKEPELFLAEVEKLRNQNINEVLMIRALIRYYINLFVVCSKIEDGVNIDLAIKSLSPPVFFKYVSDFKANVKKLSLNDVVRVIDVLQKAEVKVKNSSNNFNFFVEVYLPAHDYAIY